MLKSKLSLYVFFHSQTQQVRVNVIHLMDDF